MFIRAQDTLNEINIIKMSTIPQYYYSYYVIHFYSNLGVFSGRQ
jgi:hypothetical protein